MAAACVGSAALARPFARGSVPDRADFCDAGWIQQSGARDEDVGPSRTDSLRQQPQSVVTSAVALAYCRRLDGSVRGCPVGKVPRSRLGTRTYRRGGWR